MHFLFFERFQFEELEFFFFENYYLEQKRIKYFFKKVKFEKDFATFGISYDEWESVYCFRYRDVC